MDFWGFGPDRLDFDYTDMYIDSDDDDDEDSSSSSDDGPYGDPEGGRDRDVRHWKYIRHPVNIPDFFAKYPKDVREEIRRYFHHFVDDCKYFGKITIPTPKLLFELDWVESDHKVFPCVPDDCHPSLANHITRLEDFAKEALRRYNERMLQNLEYEELLHANVWVHFRVAHFITFLVNDGSSTRFRCKAHVALPSASIIDKIRKIDLFTIEKDEFFEVHNEAPCIREMPAQSEKAVIPCHNNNHKRHMEFGALKAKYLKLKDKAVILQTKSHVSDHMVLCPSKVIRYEGGATGYRFEADTFAELLAGDRPYASHESDIIKKCAETAVKCYNEKMVADYKIERITVAIHFLAPGNVSSYISFHAKDGYDGVESFFRTRVIHYENENWDGADAFRVDIVVQGLRIGAYPWKYPI